MIFNEDNIALDIAASLMIIPGLEARLGMRTKSSMHHKDSMSQFNAWIATTLVILL